MINKRRNRLFHNFKILNDVQEVQHADRMVIAQQDKSIGKEIPLVEIQRGHRLMRFATAAYGTEMIQAAIDRDLDISTLKADPVVQLIAFHTKLEEEDIAFVFANEEKDEHVLHHFVAVLHEEKSIVLAIRGTLSLTGAIVDIQGMAGTKFLIFSLDLFSNSC